MKLKVEDNVIVVTGVNKGSKGQIQSVVGKDRVVIKGVNLRKKHIKPSQDNPQGGRIEVEGSIHISNVMPFNQATEKAEKVKVKVLEDGKKVRVFKDGTEYGERY